MTLPVRIGDPDAVTLTEEQKKELDEMAKRFAETKGGK